MLNRRSFTVFGAVATLGAPAIAQSDALRIVVGFPTGGIVDVIARELAEAMKPHLGGRAIIVEAKPGAGGRIGVNTVKTAAPDGNTLLLTPSSIMTLYPHVFSKLGYDAQKDFSPMSTVCLSANAIAVGMHVPVKTLGLALHHAMNSPNVFTGTCIPTAIAFADKQTVLIGEKSFCAS